MAGPPSSCTLPKAYQKPINTSIRSMWASSSILIQLPILLSLVCIARSSGSADPGLNATREYYPSYLLTGTHGAVASEEARCSTIGINVLKDNGTATDAAIATALCIGVVNSFSSGIGGGGFMVIKPPSECERDSREKRCSTIAINFRETMPNGEFYMQGFLQDSKKSQVGGLAIGIPGELAGFDAAYRRFGGGVSWQRLFQPSVQLAKNFSVGHILASKLSAPDTQSWLKSKPEWLQIFQPTHDQLSQPGDWIQRPRYAETLSTIAEQGIHPFYHGNIAKQLVETINREGGKVSMEDFESYQPVVERAINTTYHDYNIWTVGPPSSGAILLHMMNMLERYSLHKHPRDALAEHRFVEALKYAAAARTELGDPRFLNARQLARIEQIKSKTYGRQTSLKIDDHRTYNYSHYGPKYDLREDHGTTHISVMDRHGSVVSITSTINLYFGSTVMDRRNGVILNDQNDDFSVMGRANAFNLLASPLNHPVTGKRPLSSMSPIIIDHHPQAPSSHYSSTPTPPPSLFAALGASGGSHIYGAVAGTFLKLLWGYDLSHAIEDPRIHHQLLPNEVSVEKGYREDFLTGLEARGHKIAMIPEAKSVVNGLLKPRRDDATIFVASDSRKNGVPAAY